MNSARNALLQKYKPVMEIHEGLNRQVVGFRGVVNTPIYNWYKYKEAFSCDLVTYFINRYAPHLENLLDPFAGIGTTLWTARQTRCHFQGGALKGIDILPIGKFVIDSKLAAERVDQDQLCTQIVFLERQFPTNISFSEQFPSNISIINGAFPEQNQFDLDAYLTYCESITNMDLKQIMRFAAFCVLEECSYTSKDGSYLRWDKRSNHASRPSKNGAFEKKIIKAFKKAVVLKLSDIHCAMKFNTKYDDPINIQTASVFAQLPVEPDNFYDCIITSPPYCNRYDYTRTYALELAFLKCTSDDIKRLRQQLLTCTVETLEKPDNVLSTIDSRLNRIRSIYDNCEAMQEVNEAMVRLRVGGHLNNQNVVRMVRNYFLEMCFVIDDMRRVIKTGKRIIMVNDNVRYVNEEVPVDLLLSYFAEQCGMRVERIFILPRGKGNSSQQMAKFGRTELRKCVYVWTKQ
ncbi:MAG: hypothetical protein WC375_09075 [Methanomassiliicoccales archaeon]|jgi:hypothetical protein